MKIIAQIPPNRYLSEKLINIKYRYKIYGYTMLVVTVQLTFFLDRIAHSSNVSAASYFPWRRYNAPKFFKVVVTVGLKINGYSITALI